MAPFESKAQARFLFAVHPKIAKEFARRTASLKKLPEHVKKEKDHDRDENDKA